TAFLACGIGGDVSAQIFRTPHGPVLAAVALASTAQPRASRTAKQRAKVQAIKDVSDYLDNTPAVCRSSYVDPVVLDAFDRGETVHDALGDETLGVAGEFRPHSNVEQAVLDLLRS